MRQTEYTADTTLAPDAVWGALVDLETGAVPMANGDGRSLDGPFAVGGTIIATPVGLGPLQSTIIQLVPNEALATQTNFNGLVLTLQQTLHRTSDGGTHITRQLQISGDNADEQGPVAGPRISEDYPDALAEILATAQNHT